MSIRTVCALQMTIVEGQGTRNRDTLASMLDAAPGADLYLAPELWSSGYLHDRWPEMADQDTPEAMTWMARQAAHRNAWLGGSLVTRTESGALANRFVLFNRQGELVGSYDKAHLFPPMREPQFLQPGNQLPLFDVEGLRVAPAICYDLRFPEMFRRQALRGVDLFLVPSEWPHPRSRVLRVLSEARAMENQAFLLLANRTGPDGNGSDFCGGSGLFGPFGPIGECPQTEGPLVFELDMTVLEKARSALAIWGERRKGIDFD